MMFFPLSSKVRDLGSTLLVHFVNPDHGMHGNVSAGDVVELGFQIFFGRVYHQRIIFSEHEFFDFDKTENGALLDVPGINFINFALIMKDHFVYRLFDIAP